MRYMELILSCLLCQEVETSLVRIIEGGGRRGDIATHDNAKVTISERDTDDIVFTPLPFPVDFALYDVNKDAMIDLKELIYVTGPAENAEEAFSASDLNGDRYVTEEEYKLKPWGHNPDDVLLD